MDISISKGSIDDYELVIQIWEESRLHYKPMGRDSRDAFKSRLAAGKETILLAEVDGDVAGVAIVGDDGRKGWVNRLAVKPRFRRRGVAKALLDEFKKEMEKRGIVVLCALVEDWNGDSASLFLSCGYVAHDDITYYTIRPSDEV